ncbi:MAG: protein phosphatase 2C domain-containing protein [Planctomycetales bacterium]|nr:protein phosphatase 2C domain-containing protein [Planctomycetales bacterium]
MPGRLDVFGTTDIGLVRSKNDDQFLIADLKKSVIIHQTSLSYDDETHLMGGSQAKLLLVADGVGGNPAGDQASRLAVQGIVQYLLNTMHWLFRLNDGREDAFLEDLKGALAFTQEKIRQNAQADASHLQMGTTITLAYIVWPHVYLIHVGDSRAYIVRDQKVIHLTHDQTYAQALVDAGMMNESDLCKSPLRHVLSGLVGCDSRHLTPEVSQFKLAFHDKLLLCTDGLTNHVGDNEIARILSTDRTSKETCALLVKAANDAGGQDNITVVLAHFTDGTQDRLTQKDEAIELGRMAETASERKVLASEIQVSV